MTMLELKGHRFDSTTMRELISRRAGLGDKPFAIIAGHAISYGQTDLLANRVAHSLQSRGVGKGDVVATFMNSSIEHILTWFACAKIGAIWAPFNAALMPQDLCYTIGDARPKILVTDALLVDRYFAAKDLGASGIEHVIVHGETEALGVIPFPEMFEGSESLPNADVTSADPAAIIYTGGTTGRPKGVLVAHSWYFPGFGRFQEVFEPGPNDVHLALGQMYHTIGNAVDILSPWNYGMTVVSMGWFSARGFLPIIRERGVTSTVILGAHIARLMKTEELPDDADNSLRRAVSVTGGLPRDLVERFSRRYDVPLMETYGQTETGPLGCINQRIDELPRHSLGSAHGWLEVKIADEQGCELPTGHTGEILLRPTMPGSFMLGYINKPEEYVRAVRDLWFHSGDLGCQDEVGDLHFAGRVAHLLRHKGENISAIEVEETILQHSEVVGCGVVAVPSDMGDDDIKAFVVLTAGDELDPTDLVDHCASRLARFKIPRYFEFVDELPVSSTKGEVERYKLSTLGTGRSWDVQTEEWINLRDEKETIPHAS